MDHNRDGPKGPTVIANRRSSAREPVFENTSLRIESASQPGGSPEATREYRDVPVWVMNASETGIRFRCRERLPAGQVLRIGEEQSVEVRIVRVQEYSGCFWEYGAELNRPADVAHPFLAPADEQEPQPAAPQSADAWPFELVALPAWSPEKTLDDPQRARRAMRAIATIAASSQLQQQFRPEWSRKKYVFCVAALVCFAASIPSLFGLLELPQQVSLIVTGLTCVCGWIAIWHRSMVERCRIERAEDELFGIENSAG